MLEALEFGMRTTGTYGVRSVETGSTKRESFFPWLPVGQLSEHETGTGFTVSPKPSLPSHLATTSMLAVGRCLVTYAHRQGVKVQPRSIT